MPKKRILIIEDDREINQLLFKVLTQSGYEPFAAYTGIEGIELLSCSQPDLILLDIMLPYKSGDSVLSEIRTFSQVPVIVVSAKDLTRTKVELLKLGADDYITKPFDIDEVVARIEANLRRFTSRTETRCLEQLQYKDISINTEEKQVTVNGQKIVLTATEYKIIELMLQNPKKVFSKENLFQSIWGEAYANDENTVNVHISNLRNKLKLANPENLYIETLWGLGYRLHKQ